jgi:hypothetical protein
MAFAIFRLAGPERPVSAQESAKPVSTALVPVMPSIRSSGSAQRGDQPQANFLAQLIATVAQMPQTRVRRRAAPLDAIAAYGAGGRLALPAVPALSRSL